MTNVKVNVYIYDNCLFLLCEVKMKYNAVKRKGSKRDTKQKYNKIQEKVKGTLGEGVN